MPGDAGIGKRVLCVAQKIIETAVYQKKKVGGFSEKLLF
jgi:hypothetical protein